MYRIQTILTCILMILLFCNCKSKNDQKEIDKKIVLSTDQKIVKYPLDSTKYILDTVIQNIKLKEDTYSLYFYRDRFDEKKISYKKNEAPYIIESPVTVVMTNKLDSIVFKETYKAENEITKCMEYLAYSTITVNKSPNNIYLKFKYNDGAGTPNDWFNTFMITEKNGKLESKKIFVSSQFSLNALNTNENEIILLEGAWNPLEYEDRASNHKYTIIKYSFIDGEVRKKELGKTKFKYASSFDEKGADAILMDISLKEPNLLKGIKVNEFRDFNHSLN